MPTPRLFLVTYTFDVLVLAADEDAAQEVADDKADDEFGNLMASDIRDDIREIKRREDIDGPWRDGIPYADDPDDAEDRTATEWLEIILETDRQKRLAEPLPGQGELAFDGGQAETGQESQG